MTDDCSQPATKEALDRVEAHVAKRFCDLEKLEQERFKRYELMIAMHTDATNKALELQAGMYERRLDELNDAQERAVVEQNRTLSKETFDVFKETSRKEREADAEKMRAWQRNIDESLARTAGAMATSAKWWAIGASILVGIAVYAIRAIGGD